MSAHARMIGTRRGPLLARGVPAAKPTIRRLTPHGGVTMVAASDGLLYFGYWLIYNWDGQDEGYEGVTMTRNLIEWNGTIWATCIGGLYKRVSLANWVHVFGYHPHPLAVHGSQLWTVFSTIGATPVYTSDGVNFYVGQTVPGAVANNCWLCSCLGILLMADAMTDKVYRITAFSSTEIASYPANPYRLWQFGAYVYCSTTDATLYRTTDLSTWTLVFESPTGDVYCMAAFRDRLYLGAGLDASVYRSASGDPGTWRLRGRVPTPYDDDVVRNLTEYDGRLMALMTHALYACPGWW